ncbi:(2Fe-2S)-binding protein [Thalassotalea mangrovi]|uniref:Bacterioferritin-associated ferredoxin n=1 Tax=Thalassotalea mangrovi TaxID=2572245 RepID=A0A4U1B7T7_9GAMM|nr:(2Fe-2S)-binding protein [Thalassotalea mangrovi]TKB46302.1 bacterioferritin [Thalassotalea mangrovi]
MYVCICHGITEQQIKDSTAEGASSMRCLKTQLAIASTCGKCSQVAKMVLDESLLDLAVEAKAVA